RPVGKVNDEPAAANVRRRILPSGVGYLVSDRIGAQADRVLRDDPVLLLRPGRMSLPVRRERLIDRLPAAPLRKSLEADRCVEIDRDALVVGLAVVVADHEDLAEPA